MGYTALCCDSRLSSQLHVMMTPSSLQRGPHSASVSSSESCHTKLTELFSEKLHLIGLAALVVAVIMVSVRSRVNISHTPASDTLSKATFFFPHVQIFEMIFTMVLCCGIRNSPGAY